MGGGGGRLKLIPRLGSKLAIAFVDGTRCKNESSMDLTNRRRLPAEAPAPVDRATLNRLERKFGGAGRLVIAVRVGLFAVNVEIAGAVIAVSVLDGLIRVFVVEG